MKLTLFGGTGLVGNEFLKMIPQHTDTIQIIAPTRTFLSPVVAQQTAHAKVENPHWSGLPQDLNQDWFSGSSACVCTLGTTIKKAGSQEAFRAVDYDLVLSIAQLAKQTNIPHFLVVSALGSNAHSPFFYNRIKGEMESAVNALAFSKLTILHPSLLIGERTSKDSRPAEAFAQKIFKLIDPMMIGPLAPYRGTPAKKVAQNLWDAILL